MVRFLISDRALDRFAERHAEISNLETSLVRQVLLAELERGFPFGGQIGDGDDELYLLPCGSVAAVAWRDGVGIVKTVLTKEQAIAGMESQGAVLRTADQLQYLLRRATPAEIIEVRKLAEKHFHGRVSRTQRNVELRAMGYDPAGDAGDLYRAAYRSLIDAWYAARCAERLWQQERLRLPQGKARS